jgi:hypothetical protein
MFGVAELIHAVYKGTIALGLYIRPYVCSERTKNILRGLSKG